MERENTVQMTVEIPLSLLSGKRRALRSALLRPALCHMFRASVCTLYDSDQQIGLSIILSWLLTVALFTPGTRHRNIFEGILG